MAGHGSCERAFTGLEAAIVLIAFVVVAAVFSYVTLGMGFFTTQKSQQVVHTGVATASSSIQLVGEVYGIGTEQGQMEMFNFTIGLAAGSSPIDFDKVTITYSNETWAESLSRTDGLRSTSTQAGYWSITGVTSEQGASNNLLEKGELFTISAHPKFGAPKNTELTLEVKPSTGSTISIHKSAPASIRTVNKIY